MCDEWLALQLYYPHACDLCTGRLKHENDYARACEAANAERAWSGYEQMMFEEALAKFPKTLGPKRWTRIAEWMPGRTRVSLAVNTHATYIVQEECIARYKFLASAIAEKKSAEQAASGNG